MPVTVTATSLGTPLIRLAGDFDINNVAQVEAALSEVARHEANALIVDLGDVEFLDSMVLRQIVGAHERAQAGGRNLVLVRPQPIIWRVFTITGLASLIQSAESVDEAEEQLRRGPADTRTRFQRRAPVR
jgi:anti-sigma B factor antagonist